MRKIILASSSPRRHELLELLQIKHEIIPCKENEQEINNSIENKKKFEQTMAGSLEEQLLTVASGKVFCVEKSLTSKEYIDAVIIGADTIVVFESEIIGKPNDATDAFQMLKKITGHVHDVYTGLCLFDRKKDKLITGIEKTIVQMKKCSDEEIQAYISSENVLDKAGAYAIQGIGAALIEGISGCYYNVMGLPLHRLIMMLKEIGINYFGEIISFDLPEK
jgi:septum formation protein